MLRFVYRLALLVAVLLLRPTTVLAGFSDRMAAFRAGDYSRAYNEWQPLAELGHVKAQTNLGLLYSRGLGVTRDPVEAVSWYTRAAEREFSLAQYNLGVMYSRGLGVERDENMAWLWYLRAAEQGHTRTQFIVGQRYAEGIGVRRDDELVRMWLSRAADRAKGKLRTKILDCQRDIEPRMSEDADLRDAPSQRRAS